MKIFLALAILLPQISWAQSAPTDDSKQLVTTKNCSDFLADWNKLPERSYGSLEKMDKTDRAAFEKVKEFVTKECPFAVGKKTVTEFKKQLKATWDAEPKRMSQKTLEALKNSLDS